MYSLIFFEASYLTCGLSKRALFGLQCLVILLLFSVTDFWHDSLVIREHTLYDCGLYNLVKVCFMAQIMVCFGICFVGIWKECIFFLLLGEVFCKCWTDPLTYSVVELVKILADFLSSYSTNCWGIEVYKCSCGFIHISFKSFSLCFIYFAALMFDA